MAIFDFLKKKDYTQINIGSFNNAVTGQSYDLVTDFVYNCISLRALTTASLEWKVYEETATGELKDVAMDNQIAQIFFQPNPELTTTQLIAQIVYWLDVKGNCFIKVNREKNRFTGLYILPADECAVEFNNGRKFLRFRGEYIPSEFFMHIKSILTTPSGYGLSPVERSKDTIESYKATNVFLKRFLEKDGLPPSFIVQPPGTMLTEKTKQSLIDKWNTLFGNKHKLELILESGFDVKTIGSSISFSVDKVETIMDMLKRDITFIFGIPLNKITGDNANYASAVVNEYSFYTNSILPITKQISDGLTDYFRRNGFPTIWIKAEEKEFDLTGAGATIVSDTPDASIEDDNVSNPEPTSETQKEYELKLKAVNELHNVFTWKSYEEIRNKYEKQIAKRFFDVKQWMIRRIKEDVENSENNKAIDVPLSLTEEEIYDYLVKKLKIPANSLILLTIRNVLANLEGEVTNVDEVAIVKNTIERFYQKGMESSLNMLQQVKDALKDNLDVPRDEKISVIDKISKRFSPVRTARTVGVYTMNNTIKEVALLNKGKTKLKWLSQRDSQVRKEHEEADGQEIETDGMFNVGGEHMAHPAGGSKPENNINCRCYMKLIRVK